MYPVCWGWEDTSVMALFKKKVYLFVFDHTQALSSCRESGLLIAEASLAAGTGSGAHGLSSCSSWA